VRRQRTESLGRRAVGYRIAVTLVVVVSPFAACAPKVENATPWGHAVSSSALGGKGLLECFNPPSGRFDQAMMGLCVEYYEAVVDNAPATLKALRDLGEPPNIVIEDSGRKYPSIDLRNLYRETLTNGGPVERMSSKDPFPILTDNRRLLLISYCTDLDSWIRTGTIAPEELGK
jgi:hypothetical protein